MYMLKTKFKNPVNGEVWVRRIYGENLGMLQEKMRTSLLRAVQLGEITHDSLYNSGNGYGTKQEHRKFVKQSEKELERIEKFQFGRREEYLSTFGVALYDDYARYKNFEMVILVKKEN